MATGGNHQTIPETLGSVGILSLAKLLSCYSALNPRTKIENQKVEKQGFLNNSPTPLEDCLEWQSLLSYFVSNLPRHRGGNIAVEKSLVEANLRPLVVDATQLHGGGKV